MSVHTKQWRWLANDLKAYHEQMRKIHENYIPRYPDSPILDIISIGTPPVDYWVSMESGSEATFVLAKDYPGRTDNQSFFDPAQSSTAQLAGDYHAFIGELEAFGTAYDDYVGVVFKLACYQSKLFRNYSIPVPSRQFPFFGFSILQNSTTRKFGVVNAIQDSYSIYPEMPDGVLGMSWDPEGAANPNENSSAIINFFQDLREFDENIDRYYCNWLEVFTNPEYGRAYTGWTSFGSCLDSVCAPPAPTNTYPLTWLAESRSLAFAVDSFTYQGSQYAGGFGKVDTGVPNILVPYDPLLAIYNDILPDYDYDHNIYTVPCAQQNLLPDWTFTIGSSNYTIPSSDYVVDLLLPNDQCALSVFLSDEETTDYVFGYIFHNLWCIKMDIDNQAISIMDVLPPPTDEPALN